MTGTESGDSGRALLIAGAGGFARETAEAVGAISAVGGGWNLIGFLDDDLRLLGSRIDGLRVLGPMERVAAYPEARLVVTTGSPAGYFSRKRIVRRLGLGSERFATVLHPQASVGASCSVGPGSVLLAGVIATAGVTVGAHVAIMPGVVLTHDGRVADFATLASGVRLSGGVRIGEGAYVGAGALVREGCSIGAWSLIGMGAVVLGDVPAGEVWAGVPARRLRRLDVPADVLGARAA